MFQSLIWKEITFGNAAIVQWIKHNGDSPLSRTPLVVDDLYPHMAVLGVIQEQAKQDRSPFYFVVLADIVYHPHTSTRRRDGPG